MLRKDAEQRFWKRNVRMVSNMKKSKEDMENIKEHGSIVNRVPLNVAKDLAKSFNVYEKCAPILELE